MKHLGFRYDFHRVQDDIFQGFICKIRFDSADTFDDIVIFDDLAENRMMVLEPRRRDNSHKELGAARVRAGIGHSQDTGFAEIKARTKFIRDRLLRAAATRTRWVAALDHKIGNDTMENRAIIKTGFCQIDKIFDRNRSFVRKSSTVKSPRFVWNTA